MDRKETLTTLMGMIELLLGTQGINSLGIYEILSEGTVIKEVPSIRISYPSVSENITRRVKKDSGIEVTLTSEPKIYTQQYLFSNVATKKFYEIILEQHNPTGGLSESIEKLYQASYFHFPESPIVRGSLYLGNNEGIAPPRAILYLQQSSFLQGYF